MGKVNDSAYQSKEFPVFVVEVRPGEFWLRSDGHRTLTTMYAPIRAGWFESEAGARGLAANFPEGRVLRLNVSYNVEVFR